MEARSAMGLPRKMQADGLVEVEVGPMGGASPIVLDLAFVPCAEPCDETTTAGGECSGSRKLRIFCGGSVCNETTGGENSSRGGGREGRVGKARLRTSVQ